MTQQPGDWELLRELEERLFLPAVRSSASEAARLLADEFVEFASAGSVFTKRDVVESLQGEPAMERTLADFHATQLAPGVVLVTYRSARRTAGDMAVRHFLRSSIWKRINGRWQMVFHQGTPASSP